MRKPLIAANWKMYKTPAEAESFLHAFLPLVEGHTRNEIVLCPSFVALAPVLAAIKGSAHPAHPHPRIHVGAQNMHFAAEGAYTGEISAGMLSALGVTHVIIGHSERRQYFGETDELLNRKLAAALEKRLIPILCVGETEQEREQGKTEEVLSRQIGRAISQIEPGKLEPMVVAYEPVWAIGTGKTATPLMAADAHLMIRTHVAQLVGRPIAEALRILYGGSVKPDNATSLLSQPEIDGALVGGASLDPASFARIIQ
jgi:triosephosphate isomerase